MFTKTKHHSKTQLWKVTVAKATDEEATDEEETYEEETDEDCHILPLTGLNAFVYTGLKAQKWMDGRMAL